MKKIILFSLSLVFAAATVQAQSLTLVHADATVNINSTVGGDYYGHINVQNTSSTLNEYIVKRHIYSTNNCAFDSAYFCWDLCYASATNVSFGAVGIAAGASNNSFSGHAYGKTDGTSCIDSIAYTYINDANSSDSLRVVIHYESNAVFSIKENGKVISSTFPNPANNYFIVELKNMPTAKTQIALYNMVGSKVQEVVAHSNRVEINTNHLPNGVYLYSVIVNGKSVDTKKVVVKH